MDAQRCLLFWVSPFQLFKELIAFGVSSYAHYFNLLSTQRISSFVQPVITL